MKKAQSVLLSHAFTVGISVLLVLAVMATLNNLVTDNREFVGQHEAGQVCFLMKAAAEKLFPDQSYVSPTNTSSGKITLGLPEKIADLRYRIRIASGDIVIESIRNAQINQTCRAGLNVSYSGSTAGGATAMELTRYSNGSKEIRISNA